jgi:putative sterol carrier protein
MVTNSAARLAKHAAPGVSSRVGDTLLEQSLGHRWGLNLIFHAMARRFVPEAAEGFVGEIAYELKGHDAVVRKRSLRITPTAALPSAKPALEPALTISLTLADFLRLSTGEVDPVALVMDERMQLQGDFMVAAKLGAMFGQPLPEG